MGNGGIRGEHAIAHPAHLYLSDGRDGDMTRKSISKKTRFEVFKRDSFCCQYCGQSAPDVVLEVDHIEAVSKGGSNDMMNFITSCKSCNSGKSDRRISDDSAVKKQKLQLDELNSRREQIEMMLRWRDGLRSIESEQLESASMRWSEHAIGYRLNEKGLKEARTLIKKHGLALMLEAMDESADSYIVYEDDGNASAESVQLAWSKVGGFLRMKSIPEEHRRLYYIKGIMRNRFFYVPHDVIKRMTKLVESGVPIEDIELEAKHSKNWTAFNNWMLEAGF